MKMSLCETVFSAKLKNVDMSNDRKKLHKMYTNRKICGQQGRFIDQNSSSKCLSGEEVRACVRKYVDENKTSVC
jgi:hypothetical protein